MSTGLICRQVGCRSYAALKYTWPGKDESAVCPDHATKLQEVAHAIGLHLQTLPVTAEEHARGRLTSELPGKVDGE